MSEQSSGHVISGRPYSVTAANGHRPSCLEDFVGERVTTVLVQSGGESYSILGPCRVVGGSVILYEKASRGTGIDVRTWKITNVGGEFEAVARSLY